MAIDSETRANGFANGEGIRVVQVPQSVSCVWNDSVRCTDVTSGPRITLTCTDGTGHRLMRNAYQNSPVTCPSAIVLRFS